MKKELQEKLYNKYPQFFIQKDYDMSETCMCWGINCNEGWFNLLDELIGKIVKAEPKTEAVQIKEKYGILKVYVTKGSQKVENLIDKYEEKSSKVCEDCGKSGKLHDIEGWLYTVCDECKKIIEKESEDYKKL